MIMLHGRGGQPSDMLALADHLALPDIAVIAPGAAGQSWWPDSFLAPLENNEPGLSSAIRWIDEIVRSQLVPAGFGSDRTVVAGFSQGACLALEFAARAVAEGQSFHAAIGLSGGLVGTSDHEGPPEDVLYGYGPKAFDYPGSAAGMAVYLGCHERDPHIPIQRVQTTAEIFESLGAETEVQIHPGAGHGVMQADLVAMRRILNAG